MQNLQHPQQPQHGSQLALEFKRQLADSSIPLANAVEWWQEAWRLATLRGDAISPFDLTDAEFAAFGVGYYDRAINDATTKAYEVAAYEASKQCCWAELE
jgi:hypothetical protein